MSWLANKSLAVLATKRAKRELQLLPVIVPFLHALMRWASSDVILCSNASL